MLLLTRSVNTNDVNFALHSCVQRGLTGVAKLLIDAHANPAQQDEQGWTMFDWAVSEGHEDTAIELLQRGGLVLLERGRGASHIVRLARNRGMHRLADFIEQHIGKKDQEPGGSADVASLHCLLQHSNVG